MKYILPLLAIILGIYLGYSPKKEVTLAKEAKKQKCNHPDETTKSIAKINKANISKKSFCITKIPNKGDHFNLSEKQAESQIFKYFDESLKNYIRPNEHNVYTQDSGPGSSAQRYDPRVYKFVGFNIVSDNSLKKDEKCDIPSFKRVKNFAENPIIQYINKTRFRSSRMAEAKKSIIANYFSYGFRLEFPENYPWFQNICNKNLSLLLSHCIADSSLDFQYEEIIFNKDTNKLSAKVYCKKSNQDKWKLIKSFNL